MQLGKIIMIVFFPILSLEITHLRLKNIPMRRMTEEKNNRTERKDGIHHAYCVIRSYQMFDRWPCRRQFSICSDSAPLLVVWDLLSHQIQMTKLSRSYGFKKRVITRKKKILHYAHSLVSLAHCK